MDCTKTLTISAPPFAYYKLESVAGSLAVDEIAARDMLLFFGAEATIVPGKIDNGFQLSPSIYRYTDTPGEFMPVDNSFTLRFWIYIPTGALIGHLMDIFSDYGVVVEHDSSGSALKMYLVTTDFPGFGDKTVENFALTYDAWHRVVAWYNHDVEFGIRIDNGPDATAPITGDILDTGNSVAQFGGLFAGAAIIDEIYYDKKLWTEAKFTSDWNNGNGQSYPI